MTALAVTVWSDVACPWCWVGKRHLEKAAELAETALDITWRAYELNPAARKDTGEKDVDYVGKLARKYHTSREGAQAMVDRMVAAGAEDGLEFRFDRIRPSNTFDAHRLLALGHKQGVQTELKEALFAAYFQQGRAMSDHAALSDCAAGVGLDADMVAAVLASDQFSEEVRADENAARELGVTGVPFFVFADKFPVPGAQPIETMAKVLDKVKGLLEKAAS